ncbi:hypothetical protein P9112_011624 [Eukaryota sp. TZLM1-RC]
MANLFDDVAKSDITANISLLQKASVKDKIDGMRRLLSMMSKGKDCNEAFVEVVKNVHIDNILLSRLISCFVIHHAHNHPTETLLAVSTHVRALSDPNPDIRVQALKALSSLKTEVVLQDILTSSETGATDANPMVRKTAIYALVKAAYLSEQCKEGALEVIHGCLADSSVTVIAAALSAIIDLELDYIDFSQLKELIHPHYRKICHLLSDFDQFLLPKILDFMTRYVRSEFNLDDVNHDINDDDSDSDIDLTKPAADSISCLNFDHRLFLESLKPLLHHQNPSVFVSVCLTIFHTAPFSCGIFKTMISSLVKFIRYRRTPELEFFILSSILPIVSSFPSDFEPVLKFFFISPADPMYIRKLKLKMLTFLLTSDNSHVILPEVNNYCHSPNTCLAEKAIDSLSIMAVNSVNQNNCFVAVEALKTLIKLIGPVDSSRPEQSNLIDKSVMAVSELLSLLITTSELSSANLVDVLASILRRYEVLSSTACRASVVHLFRQYGYLVPNFAREMLRIAAKGFKEEEAEAKFAILSMASVMKVKHANDDVITALFDYIIKCASYDSEYPIRARCRMISRLVTEQSELIEQVKNEMQILEKSVDDEVEEGQNDDDVTEDQNDEEVKKGLDELNKGKIDIVNSFIDVLNTSLESWSESQANTSSIIRTSLPDYLPGSLSFILNSPLPGHISLPFWTDEVIDHGLRNVEVEESSEEYVTDSEDGDEEQVESAEGVEYVEESESSEDEDDFWNFDRKKGNKTDDLEVVKSSFSAVALEVEESDGYDYESYTEVSDED